MSTATDQQIKVTDTMTGQELKVAEVEAALELPDAPSLIDKWARERWGQPLDLVLAETRQMMADANVRLQRLNIKRIEPRQPEHKPEPEPAAEVEPPLPPSPYKELAPDRLDADHAARAERERELAAETRAQRRAAGWTPKVPEGVHPPSVLTEQEPNAPDESTGERPAHRVLAEAAEGVRHDPAPATEVEPATSTANETAPQLEVQRDPWWIRALIALGVGAR